MKSLQGMCQMLSELHNTQNVITASKKYTSSYKSTWQSIDKSKIILKRKHNGGIVQNLGVVMHANQSTTTFSLLLEMHRNFSGQNISHFSNREKGADNGAEYSHNFAAILLCIYCTCAFLLRF